MSAATPQSSNSATATASSDDVEAITFELQGETFALEASLVQEIIDMVPATRVPGAAAIVSAVINFRGKIIPLADLRLAFGMATPPATIDSRIIVVDLDLGGAPTLVGLQTDKVHEVTTLHGADREASPRVGMRWRPEFIRTLYRRDGEFIIHPDLGAVFSNQPIAVLASIRH